MLTGKDPPLQNRTEWAAEASAFNCKAEWGGGVSMKSSLPSIMVEFQTCGNNSPAFHQ